MGSEFLGKRRMLCFAALVSSALLAPACVGANAQVTVGLHSCKTGPAGARPADVYVPMDNWVYPALDRLHGLGYLDTAFLGLRPWTRRSIQRMLDQTSQDSDIKNSSQALEIFTALQREFGDEDSDPEGLSYGCEGLYARVQGISGLTLRDSFHLGQTLVNDYGRPYQPGFNTVDGVGGSAEFGRFSLYLRGEYQHAPSAAGYSPALFTTLTSVDLIDPASNPVQATIPAGPIPTTNDFRIQEANLSYRVLNHEISFGKSDHWFAPTAGGSFLYSNNAENIYAFQIDRTEPLYIPLLSRLLGPFRYDFFVGSLKGHSDPNDPWLHTEKINFKPVPDLEFGFSRSTIWGGAATPLANHTPITLHSFLHSFFSFQNVSGTEKLGRDNPGARFGTFDFRWRLPFLSHRLTLYSDSLVHDDVSPIDAPRHAGVRPGVYLSQFPGVPRLDLRVEGVNTDPPVNRSNSGAFLYAELLQPQGYTNKGYIMGDAIGRQGKGGQAWMTYHLSPRELVQVSFQHKKDARDFIPGATTSVFIPNATPQNFVPGGTTQNSFDIHATKLIQEHLELSAELQHEWWKAPVYQSGQQTDTVFTFQLTLHPERTTKAP